MKDAKKPPLILEEIEGKYLIVNTSSGERKEIKDMSNGCRYAIKTCLLKKYEVEDMIAIIDSIIDSKLPVLSKEELEEEKRLSKGREFMILFGHMGNILKLRELCSLKIVVDELSNLIKKSGIDLSSNDIKEPQFLECPSCGTHGFVLYKTKEGLLEREDVRSKLQGFMATLQLYQQGHITREQQKKIDSQINKAEKVPQGQTRGPNPSCN
jgi:hypothetical protein